MILRRMRVLLGIQQLLERRFRFLIGRKHQNHARKIPAWFNPRNLICGNGQRVRGMLHADDLLIVDGPSNALGKLSVCGEPGKQAQQECQGEQGTTPSKG